MLIFSYIIYIKATIPLLFVRAGTAEAPMWPGPVLAMGFIFYKTVSYNHLARRQNINDDEEKYVF